MTDLVGKTILHLPREILNSKSHSFLGKRDFVIFKNNTILLSHGVNRIIEQIGQGGMSQNHPRVLQKLGREIIFQDERNVILRIPMKRSEIGRCD